MCCRAMQFCAICNHSKGREGQACIAQSRPPKCKEEEELSDNKGAKITSCLRIPFSVVRSCANLSSVPLCTAAKASTRWWTAAGAAFSLAKGIHWIEVPEAHDGGGGGHCVTFAPILVISASEASSASTAAAFCTSAHYHQVLIKSNAV